jgi:signal transduction histidine kinase
VAAQNRDLHRRVQRASSRAVALNERLLKRISADLHDGPAQLLALAALKLGNSAASSAEHPPHELALIRKHLADAMREIREICRGLTLPQIEALDLQELLRTATSAHEQRTGTEVTLSVSGEAEPMSVSEKICVYRFVQEGLNNAYRHAGGLGQSVSGVAAGRSLTVEVADRGPGFDPAARRAESLGLAGLRERIESLGGEFAVESSPSGTRLTMTLNLAAESK